MKYITEISYDVDSEFWNNQLQHSFYSSVYQSSLWIDIYKKSFNSIPVFISVKNDSRIVGQLACMINSDYYWRDSGKFIKYIGKKLNLRNVLNWSYGPIIFDQKNENEIILAILEAIEKIILKYHVTLVQGTSFPNSKFQYKNFDNYEYIEKKWITYILDLKSLNRDILTNFNKKIRYDFKRAEEANLKFKIVTDRDSFFDFAQFAIDSKNKKGDSRKWDPIFFNHLWDNLTSKGIHKVFLSYDKDQIVSSIDILNFNGRAIQVGVVNSTEKQFNSGTFLTLKTIEWLYDNNYESFDFGGANPNPINIKEKQIDFFKSKWNGEKNEFFFYTKINSKYKTMFSTFLKSPSSIKKFSIKGFN